MANGFKAKVQKMGGFLSGMVMPNIGALIAWGIFTSLFLKTGYFPNAKLAEVIEPTLKFLIPLLFAYTGGAYCLRKTWCCSRYRSNNRCYRWI